MCKSYKIVGMPEQTTDAFFYTCMQALYSSISKNFNDGSDSIAQQEHCFK